MFGHRPEDLLLLLLSIYGENPGIWSLQQAIGIPIIWYFGSLGVVSPHLPVGKKFLRFCLVWPA